MRTWKRLRPFSGMALLLAIAAPWHVLATLRNPPYFDFTMHSEKGSYHGFFWFYFINEHVLRFLNLRYPRDYNTVPRAVFLAVSPAVVFSRGACTFRRRWELSYRKPDRASRVRLLACAGRDSFWCSSRSRRRRNITRCRAIRRWRCCWGARWRAETRGCGGDEDRGSGRGAGAGGDLRRSCGWCAGLPAPGDIAIGAELRIRMYTRCRWDT